LKCGHLVTFQEISFLRQNIFSNSTLKFQLLLTLGVNSFSESPANLFISFCPSLTVLFNISSILLSYTDQVLVNFLEITNLREISGKKSFCLITRSFMKSIFKIIYKLLEILKLPKITFNFPSKID
jgi:hypothetical protein